MSIYFSSFNKLVNKNLMEFRPNIAVGVSGGPDSIALVYLLSKWIKNYKGNLIALIVDHQIRKESHSESLVTKKYLNELNINSKILRVPKKKATNSKMNQARENRFYELISFCKKNKIFYLFLGHHFDDNIETFLLRKIAGSNIEGLNSMQMISIFNNIQIVRPLLFFNKKEILLFNKKYNLKYILDQTNNNQKYSRSIVRSYLNNKKNYLHVKNDYDLVKNNFSDYKKMIFQILHYITIFNSTRKILLDSKKFFSLDYEIQSKLIDIIYKFLYNKSIRYKKINNILSKLSKFTNYSICSYSLEIEKNGDLLSIKRL